MVMIHKLGIMKASHIVIDFYGRLGWCMVAIAAIFSLGLIPALKSSIYPQSPGLGVRVAAPALFFMMAVACFAGFGFWAMLLVVVAGSRLIFAASGF